jgi:uncharacterized protein YigE (DUF2233 family)
MQLNIRIVLLFILPLLVTHSLVVAQQLPDDTAFISYRVNLKKQELKLYWKDDQGTAFRNFQNLEHWLRAKKQQLVFAMNGGMYQVDGSPVGLFIQDQKTITRINTASGNGNFHLKPNGVFYTSTDNKAVICKTENFVAGTTIKYATQSGPMLVIDGEIHPAFKQGSANVNIRNGVGILPNGEVVFAMSKTPVNFYDFASYFKALGCRNALYLDGYVSRTWLPEKNWIQTDGDFGIIIGVTVSMKNSD